MTNDHYEGDNDDNYNIVTGVKEVSVDYPKCQTYVTTHSGDLERLADGQMTKIKHTKTG